MQISAYVRNAGPAHDVSVSTEGVCKQVVVPAKPGGRGSNVNGGELLEVEASAQFDGVGLAATNIQYRARLASPAAPEQIERLLRETDAVAEVHNTVRAGAGVEFVPWESEGREPAVGESTSPRCQ